VALPFGSEHGIGSAGPGYSFAGKKRMKKDRPRRHRVEGVRNSAAAREVSQSPQSHSPPPSSLRLWTWHAHGFDIREHQLDLSKSPYADFPAYQPAVQKLCRKLGITSVLWCVTSVDEHFSAPGSDEVQWELKVPASEILAVINCHVWNRILGLENVFPVRVDRRWRSEAFQIAPGDPAQRDDLWHRKRSEYARQFSDDRLWEHLFIEDPFDDFANVVLKYPVPSAWVVRYR
jgi:hypothetical protein